MKEKKALKKRIILIFTPILVLLVILGFLVAFKLDKDKNNNTDNTLTNEESDVSYTYSNVYLLDKDNMLIPLSIKYQTIDNKAEELMYLVSLLKEDSKIANKQFRGLIPSSTKVNSMELNNEILNINFSNEFKSYDSKNELRILEALTWTFNDLDYVKGLTLAIDNNKLTSMPVNNTPINGVLTKQFGINNYALTTAILGNSVRVLSYYEKEIDNKFYYVPVTHYVSNKDKLSIYDLTIKSLFKDPGITSSLSVCRCFDETELVASSIVKDKKLYLSLTEDILFDESTVSLDVYKIIKETTSLLDVSDVCFLMDLEEVKVNGSKDETSSVSKIVLNNYYI